MNGFETILPFLKPIEHLILDDSISEVMVNGRRPCVRREGRFRRGSPRTLDWGEIPDGRGKEYRSPSWRRYFGV